MRGECIFSMTRIVGSNGVAGRMRQQICTFESDAVGNAGEGIAIGNILIFGPDGATYSKSQSQRCICVRFLLSSDDQFR